ncbi:MarR family winged helix-turn-helix transcriptional regulator [Gordonia sp. ABSL11-1]|uniref:MarR family winged helix-turn-helix transcriptional regulator n=1 Tax=Gordonia sp. ABSL11-1 TaxID=3053924 RepID=UPI002572981C|nr:MarR family winged helix-turn-helix transcriptional regulator [Gordonia sp. ABSL11-1]MDL9947666.1 MarR family winged helix-turn-helix transcriptional regulator [Gordonia sp. ABSL11-1]
MSEPSLLPPGTDPPDPRRLQAYFALSEATSLLNDQVEQHLRAEGNLSTVQFQILMRLASGDGHATMTDLADGLVHSRSGLTYQAGLLERRGLISRDRSPDDERATLVTIAEEGAELIRRILPGHIHVVRTLLLDLLTDQESDQLADIMTRVRDRIRAEPPRSARRRRGPKRHLPGATEPPAVL